MPKLTIEEKAQVFDILVEIFQGQGRFAEYQERFVCAPSLMNEEKHLVPVYDFVLRVAGHDDFEKGLAALIGK